MLQASCDGTEKGQEFPALSLFPPQKTALVSRLVSGGGGSQRKLWDGRGVQLRPVHNAREMAEDGGVSTGPHLFVCCTLRVIQV